METLKILFFSIGDLGISSSRARVYEYLPYFRERGVHVVIIPLVQYERGEGKTENKWVRYGRQIKQVLSMIQKSPLFEVVVIQRVVLPSFLHSLLRRRSRKMVYDLDDAVYLMLNERRQASFKKRLFSYDGVIASNDFLREELSPHAKKTISLPTCVNTSYLVPNFERTNSQNNKVKIGWIGTPHTEKYMPMLTSVFAKLKESHLPFELNLVSSGKVLFQDIPVNAKRWCRATELADLQEMDIGIMPLPEGKWEQMKSGYKILQYMAVGIPVVASGVGVNPILVKHGENGFIANTDWEWIRYLSMLLNDSNRRKQVGENGRRFVEKNFDHGVHFERLYQFLSSV